MANAKYTSKNVCPEMSKPVRQTPLFALHVSREALCLPIEQRPVADSTRAKKPVTTYLKRDYALEKCARDLPKNKEDYKTRALLSHIAYVVTAVYA